MRFTGLTPTEFTLLFSGAAFLAVVFYLLSFRRRMAVVAADPIWRRVVGRRRTPFRKLLALLGQVFILFLLALALADPRTRPEGVAQPVVDVVILDVSASMGAREEDGTRLDEAKRLIERIADSVGPRDRLMLMAMDDSCRPLTAFTSDGERIREAATGLEPTSMAEDPRAALNFARSALDTAGFSGDVRRRIVFLSDRFHDLGGEAQPGDPELFQVAVGRSSENLAITAFDVRARTGTARGSELFVEVTNYGTTSRQAKLGIHTQGALLGEDRLQVPAGGSVTKSYFMKPLDEERVMATLTAPGQNGPADGFVLDDRAYALVPRRLGRKVVLVTDGNLFLSRVLGLNPTVHLVVTSANKFHAGLLADAQAVVFDGVCPPSTLPAAYFNPTAGPGCPFTFAEEVKFPALLPLRGDHPVTEGVTLVDVQIEKASRIVPRPGDVELLSDPQGPLFVARESSGLKQAALAFDVTRSDLPLRIAFPILVHNLLNWFLGEEATGTSADRGVGSRVEVPGWVETGSHIAAPGGKIIVPRRAGGKRLIRPRAAGFYSVESGSQRWQVPVNFHLEGESRLAGDRQPAPGRVVAGQAKGPQGRADALHELIAGYDRTEQPEPPLQWPVLLLAAAWLLLFDWVFYCFRILF